MTRFAHRTTTPVPALSDLSVTEFLTLSRVGFVPHGLVVGTSIYDAGQSSSAQYGSRGFASVFAMAMQARESDAVAMTHALRSARALAVQRMREQAAECGAEGVVGVRLSFEHHRWHGAHMVARFVAVGTAVGFDVSQAPGEFAHAPSLRLADGGPFTSDLAGQDFVALLRAGYRPVTVAMGNAMYALNPAAIMAVRATWSNQEISEYTRGFFDARETAMNILANDLFQEFPHGHPDCPAGVVGMTVSEAAHESAGLIEFTAVGTAVAHTDPSDPRKAATHPSPTIVVPLDM